MTVEKIHVRIRNSALFFWYRWAGAIFRLFSIKKGRILFTNFYGKGYGDNPKYIAEELLRRDIAGLELIWLIKGAPYKDIPGAIRQIKRGTLKELYYLGTSQIWIDNSRKHYGIKKRPRQYYIQAWHGDICLKAIEKDAIGNLGKYYIKSAIHDSQMADLMISGCRWKTENYHTAFWYNGTILEKGTPKSDVLYQFPQPIRDKVKQFYKLPSNVKIALYAPTFRSDEDLTCYDIDYCRLLAALSKKWKGEWVILLRLHPSIQSQQKQFLYGNSVYNGSEYGDADELTVASDLIITDYSGIMFSGLEAEKKVILYASDIKKYFKDRGAYFQLEELPFLLSRTNDELIHCIELFDENLYFDRCRLFKEKQGYVNSSKSSEKVVDYILREAGKVSSFSVE